ncbi:MAG: membrane integrity-associated transporter subunit PqiC [Rhodospirillaceae bacterium]|nr:membrane integrity-associated transporter subunit PqiC [Rhodospirillaceae bacterium]
MMFRRVLTCVVLAFGVSACGTSPDVRYHTLSRPAPPADGGGAARLVEVLPVVLPGRADRSALVLETADGRLSVYQAERWAGSLAEEMRAVVDEALWRRARAVDVYAAPLPTLTLPQYRLAVRVERFDAVPNGLATVEATWTLRRLPHGAVAACRVAFQVPIAGTAADAAAAGLGDASRRLADAIADSLTRLETDTPPCSPRTM